MQKYGVTRTTDEDEDSGNIFSPGSGQVGINFEGEPTIGLGGGLSIDLTDGDLNIGGIEI